MALPYFDSIDPSKIDVLLVTHFHLDHCASLPYFLFKTGFKGRVFMTHSTKAIYRLMLADFVKVTYSSSGEDQLYTEQDLQRSMEKIEVLDYRQEVDVGGIRFWGYPAGHVLGAAMFMVDIAGMRMLYTGDYNREEDRHLNGARVPEVSPDVCIIESTYGVQSHQPRRERERLFTEAISTALQRGGKVLCPVFSLGRTQELMLLLEEFWEAHPELQGFPVYFASPLAKRCMSVYQTYLNQMNSHIKAKASQGNPFVFRHIHNLRGMKDLDDSRPCVVFASPGMLQSGLSRQLFDAWCQDSRNACVIPGYCVEGTLAKHILSEPKEVPLLSGQVVPLRMSVRYVSFSAHADYIQTADFLSTLQPPHVVLVHGEANEMGRLKGALQRKFEAERKDMQVFNPKNCQTVSIEMKKDKLIKAVGRLADECADAAGAEAGPDRALDGFLVERDFQTKFVAAEDLETYTQLRAGSILQRLSVPLASSFRQFREDLRATFDDVRDIPGAETETGLPGLALPLGVRVLHASGSHCVLEWQADPLADTIADSVVALSLHEPKALGPVSEVLRGVQRGSRGAGPSGLGGRGGARGGGRGGLKAEPGADPGAEAAGDAAGRPEGGAEGAAPGGGAPQLDAEGIRMQAMTALLGSIFGEVEQIPAQGAQAPSWLVRVDDVVASVDCDSLEVTCKDAELSDRIAQAVHRIQEAIAPIDCGCG